jgi:sporulation related protein
MWLESVVDRRTVLCILDSPPATGDELLRQILTDFGIVTAGGATARLAPASEMAQVLRQFLAGLGALHAHAFVVIENAGAADDATRAEIDRLAQLDPSVLEVLLIESPGRPGTLIRQPRLAAAVAVCAVVALGSWWAARRATDPTPSVAAVEHASPEPSASPESPPNPMPPPSPSPAESDAAAAYRVQVGAFRDPARADATVAAFRQLNLRADAQVTPNGLRQVALGPYVLRAEASAALEEARQAGFPEAVLVRTPAGRDPVDERDRPMLTRAEALAERHDVRALEALRATWLDQSGDAARLTSPTLAALDRYLDAARRVQLAVDRQLLLQDRNRR